MKIKFELPSNKVTAELVMELPDNTQPEVIDELFLTWLTTKTSASWSEAEEE